MCVESITCSFHLKPVTTLVHNWEAGTEGCHPFESKVCEQGPLWQDRQGLCSWKWQRQIHWKWLLAVNGIYRVTRLDHDHVMRGEMATCSLYPKPGWQLRHKIGRRVQSVVTFYTRTFRGRTTRDSFNESSDFENDFGCMAFLRASFQMVTTVDYACVICVQLTNCCLCLKSKWQGDNISTQLEDWNKRCHPIKAGDWARTAEMKVSDLYTLKMTDWLYGHL